MASPLTFRTAAAAAFLFALAGLAATAAAADWREGAPMAAARAFAAAAGAGDTLFVAGGAGLTGPVSDFSAYDAIGDIWRPLPSMPVGRQSFGMAAAADGGIYVSGGFVADGESGGEADGPARDFWRYDIASAVWLRLPDMPAARARHAMAADGGRVFVIGGEGPNASRVMVFDIADGEWRDLGADLPAARTDLAAVAHDGRIYAIGGRLTGGATARVDVLDPGPAPRWRPGPALPAPRAEAAAAEVGGAIHLAGGRANDPMKTYADHYVLAGNGGGWTQGVALPLPRVGAAAGGAAGRFIVAGGSGGAGVFSFFTASDSVSVYGP